MEEWDIKAAYLHAELEEKIYMVPPPGFEQRDKDGKIMFWL